MKALILQFLPKNYKERDASLDWARIIAAFLVIYGHLYSPELKDPVRVFIYQFHMPFFFLISGMLHKYRGRIQLSKYCKTILVPFLLFQVISYLFNGVFYHYGWLGLQHECKSDNLLATLGNYFVFACKQFYISPRFLVKGNFLFNGPCWFLLTLFYCKCFFDFLQKHRWIGFVLFVVLWMVFCYRKMECFFIGNFAMAFPFYFCGFYIKPMMDRLRNSRYKMLLVLVSFAVVIFCIMINGNVSSFGLTFGHLSHKYLSVPFYYLTGLAGSLMLLFVSSYFKRSSAFSAICGDALISLLVFQSFFLFVIRNTIGCDKGYAVSFLIASLIFLGCMIAHFITLRYVPFLIGKDKPKEKP